MRSQLEEANIRFPMILGERHSTGVFTAAGAVTLTHEHPDILAIDPGGASRNVTMPPETESSGFGRVMYIANIADAAEDLVLKDDGATTICTISQSEIGIAWQVNGTWYAGVLKQT